MKVTLIDLRPDALVITGRLQEVVQSLGNDRGHRRALTVEHGGSSLPRGLGQVGLGLGERVVFRLVNGQT